MFQIERVEVKDVRLPQELQRAMAAEAEATREARAKVRLIFLIILIFKASCPSVRHPSNQ